MLARWQIPDWLPLYVALLLGATLAPMWLSCAETPFSWRLHALDFAQNLLLFVPLGLGLARLSPTRLVLLTLTLSGGIELAQMHLPRTPGVMDLLANGMGAWVGQAIRRRRPAALPPSPPSPLPRTWRIALVFTAPLLLAFVAEQSVRLPRNDLSNWAPYELIIGNELTLDRPWEGEIFELAVFDRALDREPDPTGPQGPPSWSEGGPVLWLRFEPPARGQVDGPEGARPLVIPDPPPPGLALGQGLTVRNGAWVLPRWVADAVRQRLMATNELTVSARLRAAGRDADGPTRIVSMSRDPHLRDFTLGQFDANLELRVRTPNTSDSAHENSVRGAGEALDLTPQTVRASFHGPYGRIFVDGRCTGENLYALAYAPWLFGRGIAVTILTSCAVAALAAAACFARRPRLRWLAFLTGGGAAWVSLWSAGAWAHVPPHDGVAAGIGLLGLASALPLLRRLEEAPPRAGP